MTVCYTKMGLMWILNVLNLPGKRNGIGEEGDAGKTEQAALIHLQLNFLSLGSGYTKYKCFILCWLHFKVGLPHQLKYVRFFLIELERVSGCLTVNELYFQLSFLGQQSSFQELGEIIIKARS